MLTLSENVDYFEIFAIKQLDGLKKTVTSVILSKKIY